jgi:hypothetical protein
MRGIVERSCLLIGVLILVTCGGAEAGTVGLTAHLTGAAGGSGDAAFVLDDTNDVLLSSVTFHLGDSFTLAGADITNGSGGPTLHILNTSLVTGLTQGSFTDIWTGLTSSAIQILESNNSYIIIHTTQSPTGDISGQILVVPEQPGLVLLGTGAVGLLGYYTARRRARPRA